MTDPLAEIEAMLPSGTPLTLSTGQKVRIAPLNTRELFSFLKIITHGAGLMLTRVDLFSAGSEEEFAGRLLGLVALSLPDAEQEALDFLSAMTLPDGLRTGRNLTKPDAAYNADLWDALRATLGNPPPEDTLAIVEAVVSQEKGNLLSLGKRARKTMDLMRRVGELPPQQQQQASPPR